MYIQLSWINFFMTFFATFAPAALLPLIRENLSLTKTQAGLAGENLRPDLNHCASSIWLMSEKRRSLPHAPCN